MRAALSYFMAGFLVASAEDCERINTVVETVRRPEAVTDSKGRPWQRTDTGTYRMADTSFAGTYTLTGLRRVFGPLTATVEV